MPFGFLKKKKKELSLDLEPPTPPKSPSAMSMDAIKQDLSAPPAKQDISDSKKLQEIDDKNLDINNLLKKKMSTGSEAMQKQPGQIGDEAGEYFNLDDELHELESMMGDIEKTGEIPAEAKSEPEIARISLPGELRKEEFDSSNSLIVRWRNTEFFIKSTDLKEVLGEIKRLAYLNNNTLELNKEIDMRLTKQKNDLVRINELVNISLNKVLSSDEIIRGEE
ncbi:MAG TPA: hypothetical protein ENN46_00290 [Candidatus Woesearchaeota archaeon]|nr:hypothetical protein [Candidatus Woesearchaeota archaeon]